MIRTVCGPPAAGKTTYVAAHAAPDDLVIDLDQIREQYGDPELARSVRSLMETGAAQYERGDVWIIRTLADPQARVDHAKRVGAEEVIVLATPEELATQRARGRGQGEDMDEPISRWWANYSPADGDITITPEQGTDSPDKDTDMPQSHNAAPKGADPQDAPQNQGSAQEQGTNGPDQSEAGGEPGFPAQTPLAEMTVEQREAYWKHQARKHETTAKARSDYDELAAKAAQWDEAQRAQQSPDERAVTEAVEAAKAEARAQVLAEVADERVRAAFTGNPAARSIDPSALDKFLGRVNLSSFVGDDGAVDTDAVSDSLSLLTPADTANQRANRSTHQGYQRHTGASSTAAGAAMFQARQGAPTTS